MDSKGTILVVDDESGSLLMLTNTLIGEGYDVRPADSGELAMASVAAAKPELILLDICMPGVDGFEVCRRLKASSETKDIPLMFLSGLTETRECVEGLKLGAVDFVSKPFQKEELLARLETHLELSRLRNRLEQMVAERTTNLKALNEQLRTELAERRRAEEALRESEERFRSVANSAPVVIWTARPTQPATPYAEVDFINAYGLKLVGRTVEEIAASGWLSVVHPDDLERGFPELDPVMASDGERRAEYRVRRADGEYRWMLDTATPRFLPNGSSAGHVGIAVDITDLKQHQERIMAAQKLESLGVLISGVAHNFNNLMGAIIAEADLAMSDLPAGSATHGNVERISAVAIRAANIVSLLTAYASGGSRALVPVNLTEVVGQTLQLTKATVSRNVTFSVDLAQKLLPIRADLPQIRQVVMNLLSNACESLPDQCGTVSVGTSCVRIGPGEAIKEFASLPAGGYVRLSVTDTGCGIPADAMGKIFDPFYTTKFLGRGLGLAAVQGIVRGLGGAIRVVSVVGGGSTFEILFPAPESNDPVAAPLG